MDDLKAQLNDYLFMEFGVDGDESRVSATWPFDLREVAATPDFTVFEFHDDEPYFALAGESLNFLPQAGMSVDDLIVQHEGARWIGVRDPVSLSEARLGDPSVPSGLERSQRLQELGEATLPGGDVEILEGLFLRREQCYLALVRRAGDEEAVIAGLPASTPILVPFPKASSWRRLAWGVGQWLRESDGA
jgi:hypothetical protein